MPNITVLDQNTINKIAAGEVIERPASVVKELLENAIDAKATAVTVEIKEGGTSFIRVTDNGCGIPKEEVPLAFLRHSTSKIKSVEDLFTVSSLGFRGEALASIASVSQVELITKTSIGLTGTRYQIDGGEEKTLEEIGAPEGTTFIARNLFFNTPARKKFLKTPMTEGAHVAELVEKLALSHPEVSIRFIQNNQNKLHTSGNHNLKDIVYTVFGREIASNLLEVSVKKPDISVEGYIGKPVIARGNRNYENYFINGRYIKSTVICRAIEEAYKPFMMQHKYPFTMLHFTIDPETLDVNVHPTKMELRFRDGEMVYHMVYQAVASALAHKELIPEVELVKRTEDSRLSMSGKKHEPAPEPFEKNRLMAMQQQSAAKEYTTPPTITEGFQKRLIPSPSQFSQNIQPEIVREPDELSANWLKPQASTNKANSLEALPEALPETLPEPPIQPEEKPKQMDLFDGKLLEPKARSMHKLIGQLFDTYWLVEFNEQLYIIDQHAAHEKVLYEKTMATLKTREYTSQLINPPIILTLNRNEEVLLNQHLKYFTEMGFEIEPFGGREYAVRGVPANLFSIAKKELLIEMIDGLSEDTAVSNPDVIYEKIASMSCKGAVKGNNRLSFAEANELIDQLLGLENPYACPHGRPTIISMSKYELEKKFKRIV
ncbi:DNA mismatch repair endonuclease MutL [Lacrimispora aerotolerans]|uniref:DNA mismatch repair endonuclease MutL n=1 Tax=Lacrimispora aerotolerans TaxID=36832 RepID=UPI000479C008|nr:DNA mismatch repair endonuclease MutL [Lacrimispora aerotolerans]